MALGEIAGELLGGMLRVVGNLLIDLFFELSIKGPGYWLCRLVKKDVSPDGAAVVLVGILFWICVLTSAWFLW